LGSGEAFAFFEQCMYPCIQKYLSIVLFEAPPHPFLAGAMGVNDDGLISR